MTNLERRLIRKAEKMGYSVEKVYENTYVTKNSDKKIVVHYSEFNGFVKMVMENLKNIA